VDQLVPVPFDSVGSSASSPGWESMSLVFETAVAHEATPELEVTVEVSSQSLRRSVEIHPPKYV
jgi:hypothetical protein